VKSKCSAENFVLAEDQKKNTDPDAEQGKCIGVADLECEISFIATPILRRSSSPRPNSHEGLRILLRGSCMAAISKEKYARSHQHLLYECSSLFKGEVEGLGIGASE
jgi:hypothetical protein